ncbi:MAG: DUF4865 family protein [Pseudomonadota bacterium]
MIAMQYSFALPADYDMAIVERRVADKGHALDGHAPLVLKAYNATRRGDAATASSENLYAPFYLWKDTAGMNDFLCGPGFAGLVASFGWPVVRHWPLVLADAMAPDARGAAFAVRQVERIAAFSDLGALREREARAAGEALEQGALVAVAAFEPATWSLVRFRAWPSAQPLPQGGEVQAYQVLHVSHPPANR